MRPLGVRTKLTMFYAAALTVALVSIGLLAYQVSAQRLRRTADEGLDQLAAGLRGYLSFADQQPLLVYDTADREVAYFVGVASQYYQLYDADSGALLEQSEGSRLLGLALSPAEVAVVLRRLAADPEIEKLSRPAHFDDVEMNKFVRASMFDDAERNGRKLRFHSMVVRTERGHEYMMRVGKPNTSIETTLEELRHTLLMLTPVAILFAAGGGWWMAGRALKPVDQVRAAAQDITIAHLDRRLPSSGAGDELDKLAIAFNGVFERLEHAVSQMKQFTASMAHELRTPLSALQAETEYALMHAVTVEEYRRVLASQMNEYERLNDMFNKLLLLARADAGEVKVARAEIDLTHLVASLVEQITQVAEHRCVALGVEAAGPVHVCADPSWLKNVVLNLLDNAMKFTPAGGRVRVCLSAREDVGVLEVRDTGVGISEEALPRVFDRFFQVDAARSSDNPGSGLGLTIAKWAVEAQGGTIVVESQLGAGTCFRVSLPVAAGRVYRTAAALADSNVH